MTAINTKIITPIIEQHAEMGAFLWDHRNIAASSPDYTLAELAEIDQRVEAHIDALRIAGEAGWVICLDALDAEDDGTVFVAAILAFESADQSKIDPILNAGLRSAQGFDALVSALAWIKVEAARKPLTELVHSKWSICRRLGLAVCIASQIDPGNLLTSALEDEDTQLQAQALRAVGELKRHDLLTRLASQEYQNSDCQFWAAWSMTILGNHSKLPTLQKFAENNSDVQVLALTLLLHAAPRQHAQAWLEQQSKAEPSFRLFMRGCGIFGDPVFVDRLIEFMNYVPSARIAGHAFSTITGVDLNETELAREPPQGFEAGPNDDPEDDNVDMDEDEDLPWPDAQRVATWWGDNKSRFQVGMPYLLGEKLNESQCYQTLKNAKQPQRESAALILALRKKSEQLFNTKAPSVQQYQWFAASN